MNAIHGLEALLVAIGTLPIAAFAAKGALKALFLLCELPDEAAAPPGADKLLAGRRAA